MILKKTKENHTKPGKKKVVWWHGALFHIILTWNLIYPCHNATCDYPKWF
jgi:hypothetical protein